MTIKVNINGTYKGKDVKVVRMIIENLTYVNRPIITHMKISYGDTTDWVDPTKVTLKSKEEILN